MWTSIHSALTLPLAHCTAQHCVHLGGYPWGHGTVKSGAPPDEKMRQLQWESAEGKKSHQHFGQQRRSLLPFTQHRTLGWMQSMGSQHALVKHFFTQYSFNFHQYSLLFHTKKYTIIHIHPRHKISAIWRRCQRHRMSLSYDVGEHGESGEHARCLGYVPGQTDENSNLWGILWKA